MKKTVMALGLAFLGALAAVGVGCGGNACEDAANDILATFEACPDYQAASGSASASGSAECTEADGKKAQCVADCAAATSCECLGLDKSKMCSADDATKYGTCVTDCGK